MEMKGAILHDWLNQRGGAEDVLEAITAEFPNLPIYTSIHHPESLPVQYREWDIRPLWTNRLPGIAQSHMRYLPLYPLAWSHVRPRGLDFVLSNKSGFCHGARPARGTVHVCYCLTPTRYLWQYDEYMAHEGYPKAIVALLRPLIAGLRKWDFAAAQRVHQFIAISRTVRQRIQRFYRRDSTILHPPVDVERFPTVAASERGEYYLVVSRLIPYKRIDLAIQAANALNFPLKIAGRGRDERRLRALAGPNVEFLGFVEDAELPELIARCRALILPGLEDFGVVPVQAQAAGRPVLAYGAGGALDTVQPGVSGAHFNEQTVDALVAAWQRFDPDEYSPQELREKAAQFSIPQFQSKLRALIEQTLQRFHSEALPG